MGGSPLIIKLGYKVHTVKNSYTQLKTVTGKVYPIAGKDTKPVLTVFIFLAYLLLRTALLRERIERVVLFFTSEGSCTDA